MLYQVQCCQGVNSLGGCHKDTLVEVSREEFIEELRTAKRFYTWKLASGEMVAEIGCQFGGWAQCPQGVNHTRQ